MNYDETVVIDAIMADLATALPTLPRHDEVKYVEPRALRLDKKKRLLACYPEMVEHQVIATPDAYDNTLRVNVSWYAPVFAGADANQVQSDQTVALAALGEARTIRRHLQSYAAGIPGLVNVSAVVSTTEFDVKGSTTWKCEMILEVEQFEGGPIDG